MTFRNGTSESLTYRELDQGARELAAGFRTMGAPSDRVAILLPNSLEFILCFFACAYAGMTAVPMPYPVSEHLSRKALGQLTPMIKDASPVVTVTTAKACEILEQETVPGRHGTVSDFRMTGSPVGTEGLPGSDDLALLQFTSGSTTQPRGVMLSHGNVLHNLAQLAQFTRMDRRAAEPHDTRLLSWLPMFHDMGLAMAVFAVQVGGSTDLMAPSTFLMRPQSWLEAVSRVGAHLSGAPNFAYETCVDAVDPADRETLDLSTWEIALNGAEPVRPATMRRFSEYFAPAKFRSSVMTPCYGMAEATVFISGLKDDTDPTVLRLDRRALLSDVVTPATGDDAVEVASCAGRPGLLTTAIVEPGTGTPATPGRIGEIWVHGPNVARGYWQQAERTAATFGATIPGDERSWLRTGDLGFIHDGELYITGRLKDIIIVDGRNHQPQDIERTVEECHPDLETRRAVAFTLDQSSDAHLVVAAEMTVRAWRETLSSAADRRAGIERAIRAAVNTDHQLTVQSVVLLKPGSIPFTTSGKVKRSLCRQHHIDGRWSESTI